MAENEEGEEIEKNYFHLDFEKNSFQRRPTKYFVKRYRECFARPDQR